MMTDKAQAAQLRKTRFAIRDAQRHLPAPLPPFLALTDPARTPDPLKFAASLPAGCGLIYRHFGASDRAEIAFALGRIAKRRGLKLLIGNDPQLALKSGALGVHWSEKRISEAKYWQNRFTLMTSAAHSPRAVFKARTAKVDAVLFSAIFPSKSPSAGPAKGVHTFRQMSQQSGLPIYALGGVNSENMGKISDFGGVACIEGAKVFSVKQR